MLNVRLSDQLESRLDRLARKTGRSKSYYARKAIEKFIEDKEDYLLAVARYEENNDRIPFEKIREELGLED